MLHLKVIESKFVLLNLVALVRHFELLSRDVLLKDLGFTLFFIDLPKDFVKFLHRKDMMVRRVKVTFLI